jgi:hypothetical protein
MTRYGLRTLAAWATLLLASALFMAFLAALVMAVLR